MFDSLNLELTTHCDRRCKDCCSGIGINRVLWHHPWLYFERASEYVNGFDLLTITGGEPTLHPQFAEIVPRLRETFGCRKLVLQTDGLRVVHYRDLIAEHFDEVKLTTYETATTDLAHRTLEHIDVPLYIFEGGKNAVNFTPRTRRGSGKPCERAGIAAYADGKLYGCCVAPGIDGAVGIDPSRDWKERLAAVPLPCDRCWFSPE